MSNFHYFVGLSVPDEIKAYLSTIQKELELENYYRRLTHADDFHITLSFIGEVKEEDLPALQNQLAQLTFPEMTFCLTDIKGFGSGHPPRVVYAGVETQPTLEKLEEDVYRVTSQYQADRKSPFVPHITLAKRVRHADEVQFSGKLEGEWTAQEMSLFRVHKGKQPSYESIATFDGKGEV